MAKLKEIETKWIAEKVDRYKFNVQMTNFLKANKFKYNRIKVAGFDYYYSSKNGDVVRHRVSPNTNELTIKARLDANSTTIRTEKNLIASKQTSVVDVAQFMQLLGIRHEFEIYKSCDIYFIHDGRAEISIVWYKVKKSRCRDRIFLEVEVHNVGEKDSMKLLNKWSKAMYSLVGLSDADVINESLYEIYSGRRYKMTKAI